MRHQEGLFIGLHQIDDKAGGLARLRPDQEGFADQHRSRGIDHDARAPLPQRSKTIAADQAQALPRTGRQIEAHIGQIDHDPIGIGEHIDAIADGPAQIGDKTGLAVIAGHARSGCSDRFGMRARSQPEHCRQHQHHAKKNA